MTADKCLHVHGKLRFHRPFSIHWNELRRTHKPERMIVRCFIMPFILSFVVLTTPAGAQTTKPSKKLIEFGWDEPDPAFMKKHIATMEKTPFNGTVFHLHSDFLWQSWGRRTFTEAELSAAIEDLTQTEFKKFRHNFLRFNVAPGNVDWFDDFSPVLNNARLAAKIARVGKAAGILFDIEQYNAQPFNFSKQRDEKTKTWKQYAAKARERGREVMTGFQQEFPDLVVFMTWSYSLPFKQTSGDQQKLGQVEYGLLKPFLDGMFDAARGKSKIVDGFESSYGYRTANQFSNVQTTMKQTVLPWMPDHERYLKHMSLGFGLWMDDDWRKKGWNERDHSKNHFTPQQFESSLKGALMASDEYVWIYTEKPRWWSEPEDKAVAIPIEYDRAVRRAIAME
jgi:hypothetical protein